MLDHCRRITFFLSLVFFGVASETFADVPEKGIFAARQDCEALQSIKKRLNPGQTRIVTGRSYALVGQNKRQASYYLIEVPGAKPSRRWVAAQCGTAQDVAPPVSKSGVTVDSSLGTVKPKPKPKSPGGRTPSYVLAVSWEAAFCETHGSKSECRSQTKSRFDAEHFSLHGLWPQPRRNVFCGVSPHIAALDDTHQWEALPAQELTPETRAALEKVMPGTQSSLERHEWIKHGVCYGQDAETYYKDSLRLMVEINASSVQEIFADSIGRTVTESQIKSAFDTAFGAGAGQRVRIDCDKSGLITELTISLKGDISTGTSLAKLIGAAAPLDGGCSAGVVDAVN